MPKVGQSDRRAFQMVCWEAFVAKDSYVRVVDAFVDELNLELLNFNIHESETGRSAYDESALLKYSR